MALSFGLTSLMRARCASMISRDESFFERLASASSLAEDVTIGFVVSAAACAGAAMKFCPVAAAAPTKATEPKKSRRAIFSLIGDPSCVVRRNYKILFRLAAQEQRGSLARAAAKIHSDVKRNNAIKPVSGRHRPIARRPARPFAPVRCVPRWG